MRRQVCSGTRTRDGRVRDVTGAAVIQAYSDRLQIKYEATFMVAEIALPRGQSPSSGSYSDQVDY
jgi:hypothetical protein